ncbi:MAG: GNAT family N-acetyltransferase [Caldimonas sp.]
MDALVSTDLPMPEPGRPQPATLLRPMRREAYPAYLEAAIAAYAEENVTAGRWPETGALERSREDFRSLLADGLDTAGNHLFEIFEEGAGPSVGFLWCAIETKHGACTAFVYDLELRPEHRRRGHASRALQRLESIVADAGATSIGLNVFANNPGAQALYRKLAYAPTNIQMRKPLTGGAAK